MDISNPYPNILDPSKPTLSWKTSTMKAAPRLKLGDWGRASWSHPPPLRTGCFQQYKQIPICPVGLLGRGTGSLWTKLLSWSSVLSSGSSLQSWMLVYSFLRFPWFFWTRMVLILPSFCNHVLHHCLVFLCVILIPQTCWYPVFHLLPLFSAFSVDSAQVPAGDTQRRDQVGSQLQSPKLWKRHLNSSCTQRNWAGRDFGEFEYQPYLTHEETEAHRHWENFPNSPSSW